MSTLIVTNVKNTSSATNNIVTNTDGSATIGGASLLLDTAVASTSGTSINFTSIPSYVKRITVMLSVVSTSGSSPILVQLGDSGGVEITGYLSMSGARDPLAAGLGAAVSTAGFVMEYINNSSTIFQGVLQLLTLGSNSWVGYGGGNENTGAQYVYFFSGSKTLSGTLDRIRITTVNGTDTFDAGSINISYE